MIIYVIVGAVATGIVPYKQLLANDPLAAAFNQAGPPHRSITPLLRSFRPSVDAPRAGCYNLGSS